MIREEREAAEALVAWAAERWARGDVRRAEKLAEVAWAVVGGREYVDVDDHHEAER